MMKPTIPEEIERYLRTGDTDPHNRAWPGGYLESARRARADLRGALVREVKRLAGGRFHRLLPKGDPGLLMRGKVEPMVRGLFPRAEQDAVLGLLARSIFFVTSENIEPLLLGHGWNHSAWDLANLYLGSLGAKLLGADAPRLVGLSEETTCYVSPEYFGEQDPFADFIVHEAAHIFHNCKRGMVGLRETRTREWLLDIDYRKRETFAYSCEAYARVMVLASSPAERRRFADQFTSTIHISEERVDPAEVAEIVQAAAQARNGWKVILKRCEPTIRHQPALATASAEIHR